MGDTMMTSDPAIYSVGECIKHRGVSYGLVAPLFEQACVLNRCVRCLITCTQAQIFLLG